MSRLSPKLLGALVVALIVTGCETNDRVIYRYPMPWKTQPAPTAEEQAPPKTPPVMPPATPPPGA